MAHKIQIFQQTFQKKIALQAEKGDRVLAADVNPAVLLRSWGCSCHQAPNLSHL
jgi:hypothetical protein